jgi:hypothetical protein
MEQERRKATRSPAKAGSHGRLRSIVEVDIVDLSSDGLRLELATSLRPGAIYGLKADLSGHHLAEQIRITRCSAGGYKEDGRGGRHLLFKAGAEFLWTGAEPKLAFERFLARAQERRNRLSNSGILRLRG